MLFWIYLLTTVVWMVFLIDFMTGIRKIPSLSSAGLSDSKEYISVIIAAKDEETTIPQTLETLIHQTKSPDEIIVVNDRSEDRTGALIDEAAAAIHRSSLFT